MNRTDATELRRIAATPHVEKLHGTSDRLLAIAKRLTTPQDGRRTRHHGTKTLAHEHARNLLNAGCWVRVTKSPTNVQPYGARVEWDGDA